MPCTCTGLGGLFIENLLLTFFSHFSIVLTDSVFQFQLYFIFQLQL